MTNFAKLHTPKCKNCDFCKEFWNGHAKRHYCRLRMQSCWDNPRKAWVRLTDCACEDYCPKYYRTITWEELTKVPFHFVSHIAMADCHQSTYASKDGRLGFADLQPMKDDWPLARDADIGALTTLGTSQRRSFWKH